MTADSEHGTSRTSLSSWRVSRPHGTRRFEPLWSNPIAADLANIDAATMWVMEQGDAEGALRMAVGLGRVLDFLCACSSGPRGAVGSSA